MARDDDPPILITTAAPSAVDERHARERRYLITMSVRVVAFIAAIFLVHFSWWLAAIAIALSLVLPWVAVISANAPRRTREDVTPALYRGRGRREVEGSPGPGKRAS
ncbi:MAG TPA: DUF3099 domain-containing protein [Mycobacteriales bacterium]|nr:DUF3099 domain-containing protein [Mycobacteriales bacterium]